MLRVGVLLDSNEAPFWVAEIIKELNHRPDIIIVVGIQFNGQSTDDQSIAFNAFKKFDITFWPVKQDLSVKSDLHLPLEVPVLKLKSNQDETQNVFDEDTLKKVATYQLDLLLYFGSDALTGKILTTPTHGVWSVRFGDTNRTIRTPQGFWEWLHKVPHSVISLIRLTEPDAKNEVIQKRITGTYFISWCRNQTFILSKCIDITIEAVSMLAKRVNHQGVWNETPIINRDVVPHNDMAEKPAVLQCIQAIVVLAFRALSRVAINSFYVSRWSIFFNFSTESAPSYDFQKFKILFPPNDRFWADPFVVSQNEKHYLFIEEFLNKTNKGHISCFVLDDKGNIETSQIILDKPYHLSYPFIFQHDGTWYMIPESTENSTVDLYECIQFPFQWKFKRTLLSEIHAVDSTLHFYDGRFWLFCAIQQRLSSSPNDDLYLFYTHDLLEGEMTPHVANPVITDPYTARPAGRIFEYQGAWCRPSQICIPKYGYGLSLNRITELTEDNYKEESFKTILPDWDKNLITTHTLNFSNKLTVTDGIMRRFKFLSKK